MLLSMYKVDFCDRVFQHGELPFFLSVIDFFILNILADTTYLWDTMH